MTAASTTPRICRDCGTPVTRSGSTWPHRCPPCRKQRLRTLTRVWQQQHRQQTIRTCLCQTPIATHPMCTACGTLCGPWLPDPTNPAVSVHVWRPEQLAGGLCPSCVRARALRGAR